MISIIIPTLNEEVNIRATLDSLVHLKTKREYEIIVIDSSSTDKTREIVRGYKDVRLYVIKERNIAKARNFGIKKAKGDFIFFIDSGYSAPKDWVERMMALFKSNDTVGVGGGIEGINPKIVPSFTSYDKMYREGFQSGYVDVISDFANAAFRKDIFEKVGFLDEFFSGRCETSDVTYRMINSGFKLFFDPNVKVFRHEKETFAHFLKVSFRNAYWHFYLYIKYKNKSTGDSYRNKRFLLQPIAWLFFPLGLLNRLLFLLTPIIILFLSIDFIIFASKRINPVISYVLVLLRSLSELLGVFAGLISYPFKRK